MPTLPSRTAGSYTHGMKTAVSIPDEIFARADRLADARGMSRSRLYAEALREYLARHDPDSLTAAVNGVVDALGDGRDEFVRVAALHSLRRTEW